MSSYIKVSDFSPEKLKGVRNDRLKLTVISTTIREEKSDFDIIIIHGSDDRQITA